MGTPLDAPPHTATASRPAATLTCLVRSSSLSSRTTHPALSASYTSPRRADVGRRSLAAIAVSLQQPQQASAVGFGQVQQGFSQALQIGLC